MPLLIMIWMRDFAISKDSIKVASSEIQMDALAFISAVQSVNVNAWSANNVPMCTSMMRPWNTLSPN